MDMYFLCTTVIQIFLTFKGVTRNVFGKFLHSYSLQVCVENIFTSSRKRNKLLDSQHKSEGT
jgi:hypothetical protein